MWIRQGVVATCFIAGLAACGPSEPASGGENQDTPTNVGATDLLDENTADALTRRYLQCVNAAGFKLQWASVHQLSEVGILVKTAVDVPAPVHGPCLKSIGGPSTDNSSWSL